MRRRWIEILLLVTAIFILTACGNEENKAENKFAKGEREDQVRRVLSFSGKYQKLAQSVRELDEGSPIIVVGTKESEKQTIKRETKGSNVPTDFYTMGNVKIKKVDKDTTKKVVTGQTIQVLEDSVTNVEMDGESVDITIDGYKKMEQGKDYILFLRKSTSGDNYVLTNAILSKYPKRNVTTRSRFFE